MSLIDTLREETLTQASSGTRKVLDWCERNGCQLSVMLTQSERHAIMEVAQMTEAKEGTNATHTPEAQDAAAK